MKSKKIYEISIDLEFKEKIQYHYYVSYFLKICVMIIKRKNNKKLKKEIISVWYFF